MTPERTSVSIFSPSRALLIAAALIAIAVTLRLLTPDIISVALGKRMLGVVLGLLVVVYANAVPKTLLPLLRLRGDAATHQALNRFTGIMLVLGGLAYSVVWIFAPLPSAAAIAGGLLGFALLLVIARVAWGTRKSSSHGER